MAPGAIYTRNYRLYKKTGGTMGWDGYVSMIKGNHTLTGLVPNIAKNSLLCKISDRRGIAPINLNPIPNYLRDYQKEAIRKAFSNSFKGKWWPRGVIEVATGGGKTLISGAMIQMARVPTVFLCHRDHLVTQSKDAFESIGLNVGVVRRGRVEVSDGFDVIVATAQTLKSKDESELPWLDDIQQLFCDECHILASDLNRGNMFVRVCSMFRNAYMRWGLTGTAFMKDSYSNWLLAGVTGDRICEVKSDELIDEGYLAKPNVKIVDVVIDPVCPNSWPACYDVGIVNNPRRNQTIIEELKSSKTPTLILVDQVRHGRLLQSMADRVGVEIEFVHGGVDKQDVESIISDIKDGIVDHVIATTIFDEGLDIPNLQTIIFAGAKKSPVKYIQRLGRGLRKTSEKESVTIIDFFEKNPRKLKEHATQRRKLWEKYIS